MCDCRMHDVLLYDRKLALVFEYCEQDLSSYFESCIGEIDQNTVKVSRLSYVFTVIVASVFSCNVKFCNFCARLCALESYIG